MDVDLVRVESRQWGAELERIGVELGAGDNPVLFPYHFLYVTLPKIGGMFAIFREGEQRVGVGFLFPRALHAVGIATQRVYTLRYHRLRHSSAPSDLVATACAAKLGAPVVFYDPTGPLTYVPTSQITGAVEIGHPSEAEAASMRSLQREVWGSPDEFLYPTDLHSQEFGAGSSLVARVDGVVAGFLFGFYRFDGGPLPQGWEHRLNGAFRLESQTMAVAPAYRGLRIANLLKRAQAEQAWRQGIGIINWTADPLQYPNAALNFGLLRAIAFEFTPNLYPFRNDLNRVHASRFSLTWTVGAKRVHDTPLVGSKATIVDLSRQPQILVVNDGWRTARFDGEAPLIAIEIPSDWTALQQNDVGLAQAWRTVTDTLFQRYVGLEAGQYVVTGVGTHDERRYLVAERTSDELWRRLGAPVTN